VNRLRSALRARRRDDAGYSLIEVVVGMGIMSVLMVLFTTAILQVFRTSGKAESIAEAQSQLQRAFQRFDQEIRYASWISPPGEVGGAWYVEFASSDGTECLQLRLQTAPGPTADNGTDGRGVLQLLRWAPGAPPAANQPGQTIASRLVTGDVDPFELQAAGSTPYGTDSQFAPDFQRLRIRLSSQVGTGVAEADTTFTALNTSRNTPTTHTCSQGRPPS
jgi:prepilin-type N-terminal cleavage/methylation domain-containing protein